MIRLLFILLIWLNATGSNAAASQYSAQLIASGFVIPWGITFIDSDQILVTERIGKINLLHIPSGNKRILFSINDAYTAGQGGLLDIAPSPSEKNRFYFTYSKKSAAGGVTTLATAIISDGRLSHWEDLLVTDSATETSRHFGSRITFDSSGHIYFSIGDRGDRPNGQDTTNHAGSILRLNLDGTIPADNPFIHSETIRPEIWSYGHRNPQGLFYDKPSNSLWSIEHGPRGGDEVNLIRKGANYGWPVTSHGKEYWGPVKVAKLEEKEGIESPKKVYIPSIAPSNILLYRGNKYPELNGKLLAGALKLTHINVLTLDDQQNIVAEQRLLEPLNQRIRDIKLGPDGYIYFSSDSGNIYRLIVN